MSDNGTSAVGVHDIASQASSIGSSVKVASIVEDSSPYTSVVNGSSDMPIGIVILVAALAIVGGIFATGMIGTSIINPLFIR